MSYIPSSFKMSIAVGFSASAALRTSTFTLSSNTGEIPTSQWSSWAGPSWSTELSRAAITMLWLSYAAICSYDWVASWAMHWSCICDHGSFAWIQGRSAWANAGDTRSYKDISWHIDAIWYKYIWNEFAFLVKDEASQNSPSLSRLSMHWNLAAHRWISSERAWTTIKRLLGLQVRCEAFGTATSQN